MKNYSRQREEIIEVVEQSHSHPTAEEVYMSVRKNDPSVSKSTVYRNLGILVDNNLIRKITMCNGPDRYDNVKKVHHHIVCTKCGKVVDFEYNFKFLQVKDEIKEKTGFEISDKGITFYGLCESCQMNKEDN